jgi:group I intron endonuclease
MGTIYAVKNKINGKTYIGQTTCRWPIRKNDHINNPMEYSAIDMAIQKYGKENFEWIILESNIISQKKLNFLERFYIFHHNSYKSKTPTIRRFQ